MFNAYRCEICGETYIGSEKPANCPFCGAHKPYLKELDEFELLKPGKVSEKSRENILAAIELEVDNAKFYFCAARETIDHNEASVFKRLAKVEAEHASALAKLIGVPKKEIPEYGGCSSNSTDNYKESHMREERAIKHYSKFAEEAKEKELKQFFLAIVEIESDHLALSNMKTG